MSGLSAYQAALAAAVQGPIQHGARPQALGDISTIGLAATARIRRSWCRARAARAANLTLSALPVARRTELLEAWVRAGGGTRSFFEQEAEDFLAFLAERLNDAPHQKALCLFERAIVRASAAAEPMPDRRLQDRTVTVRHAPDAALVQLGAPIDQLLAAIEGSEPWPDYDHAGPRLLIAPGIAGRARQASDREITLWGAAASGCPASVDFATAQALILCGALVSAP